MFNRSSLNFEGEESSRKAHCFLKWKYTILHYPMEEMTRKDEYMVLFTCQNYEFRMMIF